MFATSDYTDGVSTPPEDGRLTPRELLSEVFLTTPSSTSAISALFFGWGLLVGYDLVRTLDNASEPFDITCNDAALTDVWCPRGSLSDPIPFNRSRGEIDTKGDGARSPINYATAYLDLDWLYGRDEDSAAEIRAFESGYLNLTEDQLPHQLADSVWLDAYDYCRQWTTAKYQHITEYDFSTRLVGGSIKLLGAEAYGGGTTYDNQTDAGVDVVFSTVALPALYSAIPTSVGMRDQDFDLMDEDGIELARASVDVAGLVKRNGGIEPILRGAAYSRTQEVDASFVAEVSSSSPLFNFPVETVQRGRDHGVPSYNDVREAYNLSRVATFAEITPDETTQKILFSTYADVDELDAYVGAIAEKENGSTLFAGPLLRSIFLEQLYRAIIGDRHHHSHATENEDVPLSTLSGLIVNNALVSSIQLDAFSAPEFVVYGSCSDETAQEVLLSQSYKLAWNQSSTSNAIYLTVSARDIGTEGMMGIGFGGNEMANTEDFVICEVISADNASCTDRSGPGMHAEPPLDEQGDSSRLSVEEITFDGDWTSVTFSRNLAGNDDSDYSLAEDIDATEDTAIIFSWRAGPGIAQHPNSQRGAALVNFVSGSVVASCDDGNDYFALHGALLLLVWMVIAPCGLYHARYCKGKKSMMGNLWWEMHKECMVMCAEALLPLAIAALFSTGGSHDSAHAKWGFYMIAAVCLQLATGWARARALEAKGKNFSLFHRVNKFFHIYAGWFAYGAGLAQCYRGLELVSGTDQVVFEEYIGFTFTSFNVVKGYIFPVWLGIVPTLFLVLEVRKQFTRFFTRGAANVCGVVQVVNESFVDEAVISEVEDRLMPRTEELPIYTMQEFNNKLLNGRSWVIVDGAVLDVSSFAKRHPGGARLFINALGTDVTSEIIGKDASIGNFNMAFTPHAHTDIALEIARSLVVGYIEEEDDLDSTDEDDGLTSVNYALPAYFAGSHHRPRPSQFGSDSVNDRTPRGTVHRSPFWLTHRDQPMHFDRPASQSSDGAIPDRPRAKSTSSQEKRRRAYSGAGDELSRSSGARERRIKVDSSPSSFGHVNQSTRFDRLASHSSEGATPDRLRGRSNSSDEKRRRTYRAAGDELSRSSSTRKRRSKSLEGTSRSTTSMEPLVGPRMKLSAMAESIINAESPPMSGASGAEAGVLTGLKNAKKSVEALVVIPVDTGLKTTATVTANTGQVTGATGNKDSTTAIEESVEEKAAAASTVPTMKTNMPTPDFEDDYMLSDSSVRPVSHPLESSRKRKTRLRIRSLSVVGERPVALEDPVAPHSVNVLEPESAATQDTAGKKPKIASVQRMFERLESQLKGVSGRTDEHVETNNEHGKLSKATKRAWEKNPHDFFHVCPLVLHERIGGKDGRPVYKFVFACPGKAAALAAAIEGVCHFNMRLAQQTGMTVVQRSYNAFAVRVQAEWGRERRVVPAEETDEGDLCIEMRIRLHSDGLMSNLLSQLIKNLDNPAVQLQGPFFQDRVNPPTAHRHVVMIAAGTGVNPIPILSKFYMLILIGPLVPPDDVRPSNAVVQLIRDYLKCDREIGGGRLGAHSRMVLIWQNSIEQDFYSADELTRLQVKAKGLLEVTALVSGDITRRNRPGHAFRRAKARAMEHLQGVNFSPTVGKAKGADEGESKHNDSKETTTEEDLVHGFPPRRQLLRDLSRVSEEAFMSRASSSTDNRSDGSGRIWDPETGGSNGMDYSDDSSKDDKDPNDFIRSLSPWPGSLESRMRIKKGGGSGRSLTSGGLEHINETREHSGQRKSRGRGKFPVRSPFTRSPQIGSIDHSSEGERETSTTSRPMPRSALPLSSASSTLRTIYPHRLPRPLSRTGPTIGGGAKSNERDSRGTVPTASRTRSPLHDSGAGLVFSKLTVDILRTALGSQILDLIATERAPKGGIPNLGAAQVEDVTKPAAPQKLVGAKDTDGKLKVVVSGPTGFIFHVESLLAELCIPIEAVVLLD